MKTAPNYLNSGIARSVSQTRRWKMLKTDKPYPRAPFGGLRSSGLGREMGVLGFEEFLVHEKEAGRLRLSLKPLAQPKALVHGHCHQKSLMKMSDE